ncbi:MAG: hypothetical protein IT473_11655 [Lysobacter sp.]|nr:hypothetical protein [Lysobacter sp.]
MGAGKPRASAERASPRATVSRVRSTAPFGHRPMARSQLLPTATLSLFAALALYLPPNASLATNARNESPDEHRMELIYAFDGKMPRFSFSIDALRFDSVETLKTYLARLPRGSVVTWSPGCRRLGGETLLSSQREMEEFRAFLEAHGIRLNLIPSG